MWSGVHCTDMGYVEYTVLTWEGDVLWKVETETRGTDEGRDLSETRN
jgi:hypothetical protein